MKVSYQNYRQQKQSSKVMRSYIVQAAAKGATEEELDILCQAYLLEQKYGLAVKEKVYSQMLELSTQYGAVSVNDYYELCGLEDKDSYELRNYGWTKDAVLNMSVVRIGPNYVIDVPRIVQCFQMKGENHA